MRNHKVTSVHWLNENEFIGTILSATHLPEHYQQTYACTGWTRDGDKFSVYKIHQGHISKIGTLRRAVLEAS